MLWFSVTLWKVLMVKYMSRNLLLLSRQLVTLTFISLFLATMMVGSSHIVMADGLPNPEGPPQPSPSSNQKLTSREYVHTDLSNSFGVHNFVPTVPSAYEQAFGSNDRINYYYFKTPVEMNAFLQGTDYLLYYANTSSSPIQKRRQALEIAEKLLKEFDNAKTSGYFPASSQQIARDLLEYSKNRLLYSVSGSK